MDYYYSNSNTMPSRGRFNSRGGSSYRGGGRGDPYRGSRGFIRGGHTSPRGRGTYYPKYEGSSKYTDSKYNSHQRFEDSPYRKSESSSYLSSREHTHHRSDMEAPRKRMRTDSYSQGQGPSRRSHDMDDYRGSSRYEPTSSYSDARSFGDTRTMFKKPRLSSIGSGYLGYKPKEDFRNSRKEMTRPSMGMSHVSRTRTRTPFRGRPFRGRGVLSRNESFIARKRPSYTPAELLEFRRAKMLKYKRLKQQEEEEASLMKIEDSKSGEDDDNLASDKEDGDKETQDDGEMGDNAEKKDEKAEEGQVKKEKIKKEEVRMDFYGKPFIKLQCPQCSTKSITFKEYMQHLYHPVHVKAMRDKSQQLKTQLGKMRMAQRAKQKKADEEDLTSLSSRTSFCPICKLNYSQDKIIHQVSESHKRMRRFLLPYCKVCRISFKSPMLYETHICSLDHLRRKHHREEKERLSGPDAECLDNFMVLDSVGSGDEAEDIKEDEKGKDAEEEKKKQKEKEEDMNLGAEYIRKVDVLYCELCRTYLPRLSDNKKVLRIHCAAKTHLRCYLRFSSDELLERIRMNDSGKKEEAKAQVKEETKDAKDSKTTEDLLDDEVGIDDKLWADVGDLLSQVEPETKSEDEDEEERFDRFKSNEKKENGEVADKATDEPAAETKEEKEEATEPTKVDA